MRKAWLIMVLVWVAMALQGGNAVAQTRNVEQMFEQAADLSADKKHKEAAEILVRLLKTDPQYAEAYLLLGQQQLWLQQYEAAERSFRKFLTFNSKVKVWVEEANEGIRTARFRSHAMSHPVPFTPINLGENINTSADEYLPALTADYHTLVFTRRFPRKATTERGLPQEEDMFISHYDTMNLEWGRAERMPEPVNSNGNEGAQTISHDGRIMLFTACGRSGEPTGCDIYMCVRQGKKWSKPMNLGYPVNSTYWESFPSLSIDGKTLFFASKRPGGYGGSDIWYSTLVEGRWTEPKNLGPTVNTKGDETAPYIHFDDKTLYFASNGHLGMGGMDIFMSRRIDDTTWAEPINLGFPINTENDENNLIVAPDGRTAFFSSDRYGGYGRQDLYCFVMPKEARPEEITFVDPVAQAENLLTMGQSVDLPGIYFATASATLMETSKAELDRLAESLKKYPKLRVEIGGHTDNVGSEESNMTLSQKRARSVYDYLVQCGVSAERMTYKGYGESRPVADNSTEEGRAKNRRTTLTPIQ